MSSVRRSHVLSGNGWSDFEKTVLDWLEEAAADSWRHEEPTLVAVPTRSHSFFLRGLCLEKNLALAGVYFRTPGEFRDDLLRAFPQPKRAASREELRLFLSLAAAEFPEEPVARSLAGDSDSLLKSLDALWASGHGKLPAQDGLLEKILARFREHLDQCGLCTMHDLDRALADQARQAPPIFRSSLAVGFSGRHWPRRFLLQALLQSSKKSTLLLWNPPNRAPEVDRLWAGTWEQELSASDIVTAEEEVPSPLRPLADALISGAVLPSPETADLPLRFLVGRHVTGEARLILAQALAWLADAETSRVGILFPKANPCSRELSNLLHRMEIPHNDTLGHASAHSPQELHWNLWLQLQERPVLDKLRSLAEIEPDSGRDLLRLWFWLDKAFQETLTDDLNLIALWLHSQTPEAGALGEIIDGLLVFPAEATFEAYIAQSLAACESRGWAAYGQRIRQRSQSLRPLDGKPLDRPMFLSWLREVVRTPNRQRAASGHHPYARIQLLTYPDAELQPWSHLIFTGLNDGTWPPREEEGGWMHSREMETLNRLAVMAGNQGEGHSTMRPGFSRLVTPEEKRAIAQRALLSLLEDVEVSCAFTASLTLPESPNREASPSDFLAKIYWAVSGEAIDSPTFHRLARNSAHWISSFPFPETAAAESPFPPPSSTLRAWEARREPREPFGPFDFSFSGKPPQPLFLPAKSWQQALHKPAQIWLEKVLKVSKAKRYAAEDPGRLAEGTWVHNWLKHAFAPGPAGERLARLNQIANLDRSSAAALYQPSGRPLPQLWTSQWEQALAKAVELASAILEDSSRQPLAAEFRVTQPFPLKLAGEKPLMFSGVFDLILCGAGDLPASEEDWKGKNLYVVDYKTGSDKPLGLEQLKNGQGVQIALYLLALRSRGAAEVSGQILVPGGSLKAQLDADGALSATHLWEALISIQDEVRLGMRGELRPEFSFSCDYPLATLAIDPDLLEVRWNLTHPSLAAEDA